jgi:hypothetical protein
MARQAGRGTEGAGQTKGERSGLSGLSQERDGGEAVNGAGWLPDRVAPREPVVAMSHVRRSDGCLGRRGDRGRHEVEGQERGNSRSKRQEANEGSGHGLALPDPRGRRLTTAWSTLEP